MPKKSAKKKPQKPIAGVYYCPVTEQNVYISKATLKDMQGKASSSNKKKQQLYTIPSQKVRNDLLVEAGQVLAHHEQSLLPALGGRSWQIDSDSWWAR